MALVVYFDEVGNPTIDDSDKDFPVFGIAMFICDDSTYHDQIVPRVNRLKFDYFGHEGVVLHSRDIRKAQGNFGFLTDPVLRPRFMADLTAIMEGCNYELLAVAIRKDRLASQYKYPADPYDLALLFAMERSVSVLEAARQTEVTIVAEQRGKNEDRNLAVAFQRIVTRGTGFVGVERFQKITFNLRFLSKSLNVVGTQMADLAAYPIARWVLDATKANPAYEVVRRHLCRQLKIFP